MQFALVDGSTGAFPYGAGIRYEANETPNAEGKRLVSVEVLNKQTQQWEPIMIINVILLVPMLM